MASEACEKENNQPHIVFFCDEDEDDEGMACQYFVCVEQQLMMESSNIVAAVFFWENKHDGESFWIFSESIQHGLPLEEGCCCLLYCRPLHLQPNLPSQNQRFLAVHTGENPWPTFKGWSEVC